MFLYKPWPQTFCMREIHMLYEVWMLKIRVLLRKDCLE